MDAGGGGATAEDIWTYTGRTLTAANNITSDGAPIDQAKSNRLDANVSSRMASYAQPTGFLAATFPATVASPTNITSASGVSLAAAYDAAKTAATQSSVDDLPTNSELATALAGADDATLAAISALGSPMQAGSTVVLTDGSLTTAKLGTFALAKGTNITGFNDIAAGAAMTLTGAYDFAKGNVAMTESYRATGAAPTAIQALYEILQNIIQFSVDEDAKTKTAYKLDGTTVAKSYTLDAIPPTAITEEA